MEENVSITRIIQEGAILWDVFYNLRGENETSDVREVAQKTRKEMYAIYFCGMCVGFCGAEKARKLAETSMGYTIEKVQ